MLKAKLHFNIATASTEVWIWDEHPNGRRSMALPLDLTFHDYEFGEAAEPALTLPFPMADSLLKSLSEELRSNGIKPDESKLEGKLEATQTHLQDLRKWFGGIVETQSYKDRCASSPLVSIAAAPSTTKLYPAA